MTVHVPTTVDDALRSLSLDPTAMVLAGGTDAMVEINAGHRRPNTVVAINRLADLRSWSFDPASSTVHLGSCVTYHELTEEPFRSWFPALAQAARTVGSPQIRHAATIGGNVATASPAGDGLPVLAALDAVVHVRSLDGERDVPFADFMVGPKRTSLQPAELVVGVTLPVLRGWQGYAKVGVRNAMVISNAGAALVTDLDGGTVRLALGSVGPTIIRCTEAEGFANAQIDFSGGQVSPDVVGRFAELAAAAASPIDDHRSTARYRRHAIGVLAGRLLNRAFPG